MGEVDHADDAVDHRVADGDQPVDRAERDAVDELLEEIFHASDLSLGRGADSAESPIVAESACLAGAGTGGNGSRIWRPGTPRPAGRYVCEPQTGNSREKPRSSHADEHDHDARGLERRSPAASPGAEPGAESGVVASRVFNSVRRRRGNLPAALFFCPAIWSIARPMDPTIEIILRLDPAAAGVRRRWRLWEVLAPRRRCRSGGCARWPSNIGVLVVDALLVRLLVPTAVVGAALYAAGHGIGLFNWLQLRLSVARRARLSHPRPRRSRRSTSVFHHVPLLWRLHRMHHADLDIDVTTGVRFHPFEILISLAIKIAVVMAFGIPPVGGVRVRGGAQRHLDVQPFQRADAGLARPRRAAGGGDAGHAPRPPFGRAAPRPTAISASICRGGTGCSGTYRREPRPATTA